MSYKLDGNKGDIVITVSRKLPNDKDNGGLTKDTSPRYEDIASIDIIKVHDTNSPWVYTIKPWTKYGDAMCLIANSAISFKKLCRELNKMLKYALHDILGEEDGNE